MDYEISYTPDCEITQSCPENETRIIDCCYPKHIFDYDSYKPNMDFISKTENYSEIQKKAVILYSKNGDEAISKYILNNYKVDNKLKKYINSHKDSFIRFIDTHMYKHIIIDHDKLMNDFYKTLKSCFMYPCDDYLILFRGITYNNIDKYKEGTFFRNNTFWSSSINRKVAEGFLRGETTWSPPSASSSPSTPVPIKKGILFIIYVPKGTKLCHILNLSKFPTESEILIDNNTTFYIKSVYDNIVEVVII